MRGGVCAREKGVSSRYGGFDCKTYNSPSSFTPPVLNEKIPGKRERKKSRREREKAEGERE